MIFIDDGSTDGSNQVLKTIALSSDTVQIITFPTNHGKSMALMAGFKKAKGDIVVTLDADLQDRPENIPHLIKSIEGGHDLVVGRKINRKDPQHKIIASKIFNFVLQKIWKIQLHDINSGLKAMKSSLVKKLDLATNEHRFIPIFAKQLGFNMTEIPVQHDARKYGKSKYGFSRLILGFSSFIYILLFNKYK